MTDAFRLLPPSGRSNTPDGVNPLEATMNEAIRTLTSKLVDMAIEHGVEHPMDEYRRRPPKMIVLQQLLEGAARGIVSGENFYGSSIEDQMVAYLRRCCEMSRVITRAHNAKVTGQALIDIALQTRARLAAEAELIEAADAADVNVSIVTGDAAKALVERLLSANESAAGPDLTPGTN